MEKQRQLNSAKTRLWALVLWHLLPLHPIVSLVYCTKIGKFKPFYVATAVALGGIFFTLVNRPVGGFATGVAAPITSAVLIAGQVKKDRRDALVPTPEQAEYEMKVRGYN